jgi:hypothetical protein
MIGIAAGMHLQRSFGLRDNRSTESLSITASLIGRHYLAAI